MADAVGGAASNGVSGGHNGYPSAYAAKYNLASHFIGGNELSKAAPSKVKDFVASHDGHTVITKVSCKHGNLPECFRARLVADHGCWLTGSDRQQRHCGSQRNQICEEVGIRDFWR